MTIEEVLVPHIDDDVPRAPTPRFTAAPEPPRDPRRWFTLAVVAAAVVIICLDTTVLNVALPTMVRDLHSTVPALEWVITGYSLTVASLLMIGGRLGDLFGHRRMFIVGASLFGFGSLLAALAGSVPQLLLGEAVIEGIGGALMTPASLAILSNTFTGHERAMAFGVWGTVAGASGALGPVVGGLLTSNASWRWSFGLNVIVAPLAVIGAVAFMPKGRVLRDRPKIDLVGAGLAAAAMFLFVFAVSGGARYGWLSPTNDFSVVGAVVWPRERPISVAAAAFVLMVVAFASFYAYECRLTRSRIEPLFDFTLLRARSFRNGLAASACATLSAGVVMFVLPVFLQEGKDLSAQANGLWQFPSGISVLIGAQLGARAVRRIGPARAIRAGLVSMALGLAYLTVAISPDITFWRLLPALILNGMGFGACLAQLANVILSEIRSHKMGVASAATSATRHLGSALGVAIVGSAVVGLAVRKGAAAFGGLTDLSPGVRADALVALHSSGVSFTPPVNASPREALVLDHAFVESLATACRVPIMIGLAAIVVAFGLTWRLGHPVAAADPVVRTKQPLAVH